MSGTVANQALTGLDMGQLFASLNYELAFQRAMKVFYMAFSDYASISPQLYQQKHNEFLQAMLSLYGIQLGPQVSSAGHQQFIETSVLSKETVQLKVGVKECYFKYPMARPISPGVQITIDESEGHVIPLDVDWEVQNNVMRTHVMPYNTFRQNRVKRIPIRMRLAATQWPYILLNRPLEVFEIDLMQIHAEGFEEWFDFGRGVLVLIRVEYVMTEPGKSQLESMVDSSNFQFHSLSLMLVRALTRCRTTAGLAFGSGHKVSARKYRVTYMTGRVDPNHSDAYWSSAPNAQPGVLASLQTPGAFDRPRVRYCDLQIGQEFEDEFPDNVCVCSEWCNWNAFFHHNPIYRFLLVAHNRLYLSNRSNIPDVYLFVSLMAAKDASETDPIPYTPVLQLVNCAHKYMKWFYNSYYMQKPVYRLAYFLSVPSVHHINALSYNVLRYTVKPVELCHQLNTNPFADICIETLNSYYEVFSHLHTWVSKEQRYVDQTYDIQKQWFREYDAESRQKYLFYIEDSCRIQIQKREASYDHLFSEDYEYSRYLPKNYDEMEEKRLRDRVLRKGVHDNRYNVRVICSPVADIWRSVHKFIAIVDPMLSAPKELETLEDMYVVCQGLECDFNDWVVNEHWDLQFAIPDTELQNRNVSPFRKHFYALYTLKLYAISYEIQSYCINAGLRYHQCFGQNNSRVYTHLKFIYDYRHLERTFQMRFPNESLFTIDPNVNRSIKKFYLKFWPKAGHQISPTKRLLEWINSGYMAYNRLYFWWYNNGNNRPKFQRIIRSFTDNLNTIVNRSKHILHSYILPIVGDMKTRYTGELETQFGAQIASAVTEPTIRSESPYVDTMDELVLYLVKADAYMIVSLCATYLRKLHSLKKRSLHSFQYLLSKPGWVPLMRVWRDAKMALNRLKTLYMVFDDSMERIDNTLNRTKRRVRDLFRDFYKNLMYDWKEEIDLIFFAQIPGPPNLASDFLSLHLSVGLSVLAAFVDDFRKDAHLIRKSLLDLLTRAPPLHPLPHQLEFQACAPICRRYLRDAEAIEMAQPFLCDIWYLHLHNVFTQFDKPFGHQLNVDLQEANHWD